MPDQRYFMRSWKQFLLFGSDGLGLLAVCYRQPPQLPGESRDPAPNAVIQQNIIIEQLRGECLIPNSDPLETVGRQSGNPP
jgi:hypothetical protein